MTSDLNPNDTLLTQIKSALTKQFCKNTAGIFKKQSQENDSSDCEENLPEIPDKFKAKQSPKTTFEASIPDPNNIFKPSDKKTKCDRCNLYYSPTFARIELESEHPKIKLYNDTIEAVHYNNGIYDSGGCSRYQQQHAYECGISLTKILKANRDPKENKDRKERYKDRNSVRKSTPMHDSESPFLQTCKKIECRSLRNKYRAAIFPKIFGSNFEEKSLYHLSVKKGEREIKLKINKRFQTWKEPTYTCFRHHCMACDGKTFSEKPKLEKINCDRRGSDQR